MARGRPLDVEQELLEAFRHSGRVNEYLVSALPASLWRAAPPTGDGSDLVRKHFRYPRRSLADVDMRNEMRFHSEMETERLMREQGLSPVAKGRCVRWLGPRDRRAQLSQRRSFGM